MNFLDIYEKDVTLNKKSIFGSTIINIDTSLVKYPHMNTRLFKSFLLDNDVQEMILTYGNIGFTLTFTKKYKKKTINLY